MNVGRGLLIEVAFNNENTTTMPQAQDFEGLKTVFAILVEHRSPQKPYFNFLLQIPFNENSTY